MKPAFVYKDVYKYALRICNVLNCGSMKTALEYVPSMTKVNYKITFIHRFCPILLYFTFILPPNVLIFDNFGKTKGCDINL